MKRFFLFLLLLPVLLASPALAVAPSTMSWASPAFVDRLIMPQVG